jgi:hypothetical protein
MREPAGRARDQRYTAGPNASRVSQPRHLVMASGIGAEVGLPPGWGMKTSRATGEVYYVDLRSGTSTFQRPGGDGGGDGDGGDDGSSRAVSTPRPSTAAGGGTAPAARREAWAGQSGASLPPPPPQQQQNGGVRPRVEQALDVLCSELGFDREAPSADTVHVRPLLQGRLSCCVPGILVCALDERLAD